jgi:hypothetical protein
LSSQTLDDAKEDREQARKMFLRLQLGCTDNISVFEAVVGFLLCTVLHGGLNMPSDFAHFSMQLVTAVEHEWQH